MKKEVQTVKKTYKTYKRDKEKDRATRQAKLNVGNPSVVIKEAKQLAREGQVTALTPVQRLKPARLAPKGGVSSILPSGSNQFQQKYTPEVIERLAGELLTWFMHPDNWWLTDFATSRLLTTRQMLRFCESSEVFAQAYAICKEIQARKLVEAGRGDRHPAMTIFALKNVCNWRDNQEVVNNEGVQFNLTGIKEI